jgi:hypothetical protein
LPEKPFILIALTVLNSGRGFAEYYQHSPGRKKPDLSEKLSIDPRDA